MKITIDTKEDSPEEIRKLIRMLSALVGDSSGYDEKAPPSTGEGLFDMFGDPAASTSQQQQLGKGGGSGSSGGAEGAMDINDFLEKPSASESSNRKPSSDDDNDELKVVPY